MKFCNYRVYICLSANIDQLEIKLQKRKAEKNKNQKKKRKLTFLGNFPFQPLPFLALPFSAVTPPVITSLFLSLPRGPHLSALLLPASALSFFGRTDRRARHESDQLEPREPSGLFPHPSSPLLSLLSQENEPVLDRIRGFKLHPKPSVLEFILQIGVGLELLSTPI
jgi:hypothetical protein